MRRRLAEFPPGTYRGEDFLDDDGWSDEPVRVALAITVSPEKLVLDFAGSSPQRPGNINAVAPMTYSASFFAIKVLTDPEIPVNAGTFRSVEIAYPGRLVPRVAHRPAAVCAGNTETTQRDRRHGAEGLRPIRARPRAGGEPGHDEHDRDRRPRPARQNRRAAGPTAISRRSAAARAAGRWGRAMTASSAT